MKKERSTSTDSIALRFRQFRILVVVALVVCTLICSISVRAQDASGARVLNGGATYNDSSGSGDEFNSSGDSSSGPVGTDEFDSSGGGGDEFNSNGSGGDEFNSNGGGPGAYPTPPPRFPCGPNAMENQAWGGPAASGFLGMLGAIIAPNCPQFQTRRRLPPMRPVFTYYYINGINTPRTKSLADSPGNWRGSCQTEHDTVAQNLLGKKTISPIPQPRSGLVPIRVADEQDVMFGLTCNPSGQDPWNFFGLLQKNCGPNMSWFNAPFCSFFNTVNAARAGTLFGMSLTPGDLIECFRQASHLPASIPVSFSDPIQLPGMTNGIGFSSEQPEVVTIVNSILAQYREELRPGPSTVPVKHYFIVVGHSQGNFFVEGVAYRLLYKSDADGKYVFSNRLGIISLASPTSYDSLPLAFRQTKIKHRTRADDGINALFNFAALMPGKPFKTPWPLMSNDLPLWRWRIDPSSLFRPASWLDAWSLVGKSFDLMGSGPLVIAGGILITENGPAYRNPELYSPLLNSHLLDNYLDDPTATKPNVPFLSPKVWDVLGPTSPPTNPILNCVRYDLLQLKATLLNRAAPMTLPPTGCINTNAAGPD